MSEIVLKLTVTNTNAGFQPQRKSLSITVPYVYAQRELLSGVPPVLQQSQPCGV